MQIKTYACYNKNDLTRLNSSSGGVFCLLASHCLSLGGVVYGVSMTDDCYSASFVAVEQDHGESGLCPDGHLTGDKCLQELDRLMGSKYFQAELRDTYRDVKAKLDAGKPVLFSGTGCQINGLKNFLKASDTASDNLLCVDVICHGVPSKDLWRRYVKYQESKQNGKLTAVNFRCKDDSWTDFGMKELLKENLPDKYKKLYISKDNDSFMQMFLRDYCLRPSCYECAAKNTKMSDITLGDFWGIDRIASDMNDGRGTSVVLVRTEKGAYFFDKIYDSLHVREVSYEEGVEFNPSEYSSVARPPQRDGFFEDMHFMSFEELKLKYAAPVKVPLKVKVKRKLKHILKPVIRKFRSGGANDNADYGMELIFLKDKRSSL